MYFGRRTKNYIISGILVFVLYSAIWAIPAPRSSVGYEPPFAEETVDDSFVLDNEVLAHPSTTADHFAVPAIVIDTLDYVLPLTPPDTGLKVKPKQPSDNPLDEDRDGSPFGLKDPQGTGPKIEYDPKTNSYNFQNMTGDVPYGPGASMSLKEYMDYDMRQEMKKYWKEKGAGYVDRANRRGGGLIPQLRIGGEVFESIFGSNTIDIRPSGNVELIFGFLYNQTDNDMLPVKQRKVPQFNFDENIQLNVLAKIGDKIDFNLNYNTEPSFEFDNKMKLQYQGKEDEIIQLLEFGDVTLPLNSSLIVGSQSLFGLKSQLQFGKLMVTSVLSQQKAESQTITVSGGAQTTDFYIKADEYEENKHFFISQYFRDHYNQYMSTLPLVGSPIVITKIEVWRTTVGTATSENRNIVAFTDLGEASPTFNGFSYVSGSYPSDDVNNLNDVIDSSLYRNLGVVNNNLKAKGLTAGVDFEKVESARLLSPSEYTFNSKLGFISLNTALTPDQVLAVAFQFTVIGDNRVYQVGEFSNQVSAPNCIRVKLLKSTNLNTKSPLWKLMMKNVYSLSAYQVAKEDFRLNILYKGDEEGIGNGFFNEGSQKGVPLIRLLGMDRLNQQDDPYPDGVFDFLDNAAVGGGIINSTNGRIYFPTIEPFGKDLRDALGNDAYADKYAFDTLYTTTKTLAQQYTSKNKYYLEGTYKSSYGSEIYLNAMNVPEGSVKVTAGGIPLTENVDYTVNYAMGTVTIINDGVLKSGTPINISLENQSQYGMITRYMFGLNLDYKFSDNFNIGATLLNLREQPITQKVNYGDEPINNHIWGMNFAYKTKLPWLTKFIDWLPFHSTTAESNMQLEGEFAHFIPGHSRAVGKEGTTYIDDFEATKSTVDLRNVGTWALASTPQYQQDLFPEARSMTSTDAPRRQLAYGYNRARLAWYVIDPLFYRNNNATPKNITAEDQSQTYAREVYEAELFPYKEQASTAEPTNMSVFNLAFYPSERGPYNYDVNGAEGYSAGVSEDGSLNNPETRWGGIMRRMDNTDFESSNFEYIEFWMMDPFIDNPNHRGGKLYFNLGDISEDILRDGMKFFENGLPSDGTDENCDFTVWGRVPTIQMIVNAFENEGDARDHQDVGFDGLSTDRERDYFYDNYLKQMEQAFGTGSQAYQMAYNDPSSDNFHYFRGTDYDEADVKILERYKYFNNAEGNSPTQKQNPESYPTTGSSMPNVEDVNNDYTLSEDEKYYQYEIDLRPDKMVIGENYIYDIFDAVPDPPLPDGSRPKTRWYQFKIPIKQPDKVVGDISGFNSIRFMRVFMRDFAEPVVCRLATFELVRSDWRAYSLSLMEDGDYTPGQGSGNTSFSVSTLSFEENANRTPIPYTLPPGIEREQGYGGTQQYYVNEQALSMKVTDLADGDARAIYKTTAYDLRRFKKLKMFVHGEKVNNNDNINNGDVTVFIRLGSDFTENYYEYELPLELTPWYCGPDSTTIWPRSNRIDISLDSLVAIKQRRNTEIRRGLHEGYATLYEAHLSGGRTISVLGTPNLAEVTTIMIGVRNPKKQSINDGDDMLDKSVEVWINELRLCGYDEKSGFAALARMRVTLADIGDLTLSGTYSTPGFGTLEQKVTQTQQETMYTFDLATNIEAGKVLFPDKWNIKIPLHYDYSINVAAPQYNPLNPDVKLKEDLRTYDSKAERDSIKRMTTDFIQRQNINLMNVRKERDFDKPIKIRPWDIENFDFSYAYSEIKSRNVDVELDNKFTHEGEIGYAFNYNPKNIRPFAKQKWLKSKWLQIIRDFNFYPLPKMVTVRTSIHREMNEFKLRPKSKGNIIIDTSYVKTFDWMRNYALRWDLTQGLRFEYTANANARLDEPQGRIDTRVERDSIWRSFGRGGRTTNFQQRFDASYQLPINKIPLFNWITASVRYSSTYNFTAAALSMENLGNTIQNSNTKQANASLNMVTLYNNIPYLKRVNQGAKAANKKDKKKVEAPQGADTKDLKADKKSDKKDDKKKSSKDSVKVNVGKVILDGTVRFLMMVRNISASYSEGNGTIMPGYKYRPNMFGIHFPTNSPGFLFAFGAQPDIRHIASEKGWLSMDTLINSSFQSNHNQTLNFRATVEPFKDFRIDVTANRTITENFSEYYVANSEGVFNSYSPQRTGNFSITFFGLPTMFTKGEVLFENLKSMRYEIAQRLSARNPNSNGVIDANTGYPVGYSGVSQDVLIPAFIAAYSGRSANKVDVSSPFPKIPMPNWRLNYTGFTKIKGVNKVFQSLSLTHAYTSTYTVGSFTTNLLYTEDVNGFPNALDALGNFIPTNEIAQITVTNQLNPLIGFDMTLVNSLILKVEYKTSRSVSLSFTNNQVTEVSSNEFVFSTGYRFKDLKIGFVFSGAKRQVVSDLNVTLGVGIRDNRTVLRKLVEDVSQVTSGTLSCTINAAADYQISSLIGLTFYYDHIINRPHMLNQYPTMTIDTGVKVRLMLSQ